MAKVRGYKLSEFEKELVKHKKTDKKCTSPFDPSPFDQNVRPHLTNDFKVDSFTKNDISEYTQVPVLNYFEEFAQNYNGGYYKAQIDNGKLTYLFAVYRQ